MKAVRSSFLYASAAMYALFAYLQLNDFDQYGNGDAWAWILLYAISALLPLLLARRPLPVPLLAGWCGFTAGALFFKLQDETGNFHLERLDPGRIWDMQGNAMVQQTNETAGLALLLVWSICYLLLNRCR